MTTRKLNRRDLVCGGMAATLLTRIVQATEPPGAPPGSPTSPDIDISLVHPELRAAVPDLLRMQRERGEPNRAGLPAAREAFVAPGPLAGPPWRMETVSGPGGTSLKVYVVNAGARATARPGILHTHGGGFISGSARASIAQLQAYAQALDCVIVSVEYRLAPESIYRDSLEDNYAGLKWLFANAAALGVDPRRIAVLGESAGGGHAALLALAARDRGEVKLAFQALVYPMLDDRTGSSRAVSRHIGGLLWTPSLNRFGWSAFLGVAAGSTRVPRAAVPARYESLAGLPPTFIGVGSIDLFVEEDILYAQRLIRAGVSTQLVVVPGAFHGFDVIAPQSRVAAEFTATVVKALAAGLGS